MSLQHSAPLNQADLGRLDEFLRKQVCDRNAMGLSYTHGFLTAIASVPARLETNEWLRLVFGEPAFHSDKQTEEIHGLAMRLFDDIDHRLKTNVGFLPIFDHVRDGNNHQYIDAQPWCLGFTDGLKLFSEDLTAEANQTLQTPLALIFRLADLPGQPDSSYARLCDALPDATEYIYTYWQAVSHK